MRRAKQLLKSPEFILIALIAVFRVIYFLCLDYCYEADSYEYIVVDGFGWLQGAVDRYRLPMYPMLIEICQYISQERFALLLCTFQLIVSLISVIVFYLTVKKIISKKGVCLAVTFLYGTLNAICGWDKTLLIESLSLSLTVFVLFGIVSFLQERKYKYVIFTSGVLLFGCLLRAIFAIYAGLFFGFLVLNVIFPGKDADASLRAKTRGKNSLCALISVFPIALVLLYASLFSHQYGGFTISDSSLGQQLHIVLEDHYYEDSSDRELKMVADSIINAKAESKLKAEVIEFVNNTFDQSENKEAISDRLLSELPELSSDIMLDSSIEKEIDDIIYARKQSDYNCSYTSSVALARWHIMENYDRDRVASFVDEAKKNHILSYVKGASYNCFESYDSYKQTKNTVITETFVQATQSSVFALSLTIFHSLLVSFAELLSFVVIIIKKKKVDWLRLGLGAYILATVVLSIFGTNSEYARTAIASLPFMFVAIALYASCVLRRIEKALKSHRNTSEG